MEDSLCRSLFLLLRSENIELFTTSLRVLYLIFQACRFRLKFQLAQLLDILTEVGSLSHGRLCRHSPFPRAALALLHTRSAQTSLAPATHVRPVDAPDSSGDV